jgi:hypothetical protein
MQSNKTSKKTRNNADETASPMPDTAMTSDTAATPRASKSSKPKNETGETAPAKRHRKAATVVAPQEESVAATGAAVAMAPEPTITLQSAATEPEPAIQVEMSATSTRPSRDEVARLAYSYWLARGCGHGSHQEDWFRAERELTIR